MKSLILIIFLLSSCATVHALELEMPKPVHISDLGKATAAVLIVDHSPKKKPESMIPMSTVLMCVDDQVDLYGDLCGEADTDGDDAHFNGVKCAVEAIKGCLELEK